MLMIKRFAEMKCINVKKKKKQTQKLLSEDKFPVTQKNPRR